MRLFVAVDVDEMVRERVKPALEKFVELSGIKAVEPENLHITLLFLGEVNEGRVGEIEDSLSSIEFEPFKIAFHGMGAFPNPKSPRVVWIGVKENGELTKLANAVYGKLRRLGFKRDKDFSAHLTIARVKRKNPKVVELIKEHSSDSFGEMEVKNFKLKQSILKPQGPVYKDLRVFGYED